MYFTDGSSRAFEMLMRGKLSFDRYENGGCADCVDCNTCHFYRPHWKYYILLFTFSFRYVYIVPPDSQNNSYIYCGYGEELR